MKGKKTLPVALTPLYLMVEDTICEEWNYPNKGNNMSKKVQVGIVGLGRISDMHFPAYINYDKAEIAVVCDSNEKVARRRAAALNCRWTTRYEDLLEDKSIQVLEILTPHHLHKSMVIDAAYADKHISVQKPMCLNITEAREMIDATKKANVLFKVFENFVFYPPYVLAKKLMEEGEIGDPLSIRIKLGSGGRGGWPIPLSAWVWRVNKESCGGGPVLFDDGYHKYSIALWFFGDVEEIYAHVDYTFDTIDAPSIVFFKFKEKDRLGTFEAAFQPHLWVSSKYYPADERVEITGTKGVIWITRCTAKLMDVPPIVLIKEGKTRSWEHIRADWMDSFTDSARYFIEECVIPNKDQPILTGEEGLRIIQCAHASYLSGETGEKVDPSSILD